ncbi:MAG: DUF4167 domain-containing protein [Hyphomicrobium sp.]|uniref:DUF4167 domain-containing protein n=1 Tax=Hyphomicrobium sp. TaxID=82 RepID=UPI0039E34038
MRQGQQNRRGRGRNNNNNRKSQNPLMRSFESSGPDVKIRGTPSHIAEKYISLARDALSSGDPVLAENYLQHAEHYNRIILGYREQMVQQGGMDPMGNGAARTHSLAGPEGVDSDEFGEDEGDEFGAGQQPQVAGQGGQPDLPQQPFQQQQPRNFDNQNRYDNRQRHDRYNNNRHDRGERGDRGDRQDFRGDRNDRGDRQDRYEQRNGGEGRYRDDRRPHNNGGNGEGHQAEGGYRRRERYQGPNGGNPNGNGNGADREHANGGFAPSVASAPPPVERERPVQQVAAPEPAEQQEQPAFLRRPVRRPRREEAPAPAVPPAANEDSE